MVEVLRSRDEMLARQADHLIAQAIQVLPFTISTFPTGTSHGPDHTTSVEQIALLVLSNEFLASLTDLELFFLVLACHFHDLAMSGTAADDATFETREQVRLDHAVRVGEKISEKWLELGFDKSRDAEILGEICRGHRPKKGSDGHASWDDMEPDKIVGIGQKVRMRLIAAIIYAVDELHLGADRAPERIEKWREIRDEESRRHWRRHQSIEGPARNRDGGLAFEISVMTPEFEESIRKDVLIKALRSIEDLRRQTQVADITTSIPIIEIKWDRKELWSLLLPIVTADLIPRTQGEIESAIVNVFRTEVNQATNLEGLCKEQGMTDEDVRKIVHRHVSDAVTSRTLVKDAERAAHLILSTDDLIYKKLVAKMRDADDLDRLMLGQYRVRWMDRFFRSNYGRAYINSVVIPTVANAYSVDLAAHPSASPVRKVLESIPTAARVVMENRPEPGNLVRLTLVELGALAGATFDLFDDPELLLDRDLRHAYRQLASNIASKLDQTIRFLEELAIVGGLPPDQVASLQITSDAEQKALKSRNEAEHLGITLTLSQSLNVKGSKRSLISNLMLAGRRAQVPIQLTDAPGHPFEIKVTSEESAPLNNRKPLFLEVGTSKPVTIAQVSLQARITYDNVESMIKIIVKPFDRDDISQWPLRVRMSPSRSNSEQRGKTELSISARAQWLTIGDVNLVGQLMKDNATKSMTLKLIDDTSGSLFGSHVIPIDGSPFTHMVSDCLTQTIVDSLSVMGAVLPVPIFIEPKKLEEIAHLPSEEWPSAWRNLFNKIRDDGFEITTLVLGMSNAVGKLADEELLDSFPGRMRADAKIDPGESISQEEFDKIADDASDTITMTGFCAQDMFEVSEIIREWSRDISRPFPLQFGSKTPASMMTRTAVTMSFLPPIDRTWHKEWPMRIELRPVNQREALECEAKYWHSVSDERRAEIIEERLKALD